MALKNRFRCTESDTSGKLNNSELQDIVPAVPTGENGIAIIAGPCSAETRQQTIDTANALAANGVRVFRAGLWKPRTRPGTFEGCGEEGLAWLQEVKKATGMLVATEIASPRHAKAAINSGIDILWIGARTTTNPFAVQEIADELAGTNAAVIVKNPANPDLELWIGALQRFYNAGIRRISAVHRGFSAYGNHFYRNPPQWHIPIELHRRYPSLQLICDPSHIGGKRDLIAPLSQQAIDLGFNGLIIETHSDPEKALSDAAQQITPSQLHEILATLVNRTQHTSDNELTALRQQIDQLDSELLDLLAKRMSVAMEIGRIKKANNQPILQPQRYETLMKARVEEASALGLDKTFISEILAAIHAESVNRQLMLPG